MLEKSCQWVSWSVKNGRPDAVPGCQHMDALPDLGEGQSECEEGNSCYYYRCKKCLSRFVLDDLNSGYLNRLIFIPRFSDISTPKLRSSDHERIGYQGEIGEFCANVLAQMNNLKGVAIRSWRNVNASLIFDNVQKCFLGTKHEKSEDFEIDWMIFNGSSLTIVEIGMRGVTEQVPGQEMKTNSNKKAGMSESELEDEKIERVVSKKLSQLIKDQFIVDHLLDVADCTGIPVNYLAVFPNIPIEKIKKRVENKLYKETIQDLVSAKKGLVFS